MHNKTLLGTSCLLLLFTVSGCGGSSDQDSSNSGEESTTYTVNGSVAGLLSGSTVVLQNNDGDDLSLSVNGSFAFSTVFTSGSRYQVTVLTQPTDNSQYCNVLNGNGSVGDSEVTNITISCVTGLYNIVDTGQTKCFDSSTGAETVCSGTGYDADYSGTQPSYRVSDDGTLVIDTNTGLVWTQTPDTTGDGTIDINDKMTQADAQTYCSGLDYSGYTWRLPSVKELYSLIKFTGTDPSGVSDTSNLVPFMDDTVFSVGFGDTSAGERTIDGQAATSTLYLSPMGTISGAETMFGVNFVDGRIKGYPYNFPTDSPKTFYVYCVSGNSDYGVNAFSDNGDSTISDNATGLMWQQDDYQSSDYDDAIAYCENSSTGSYSDWRLPNIKELQSIVDYSRSPDSSNSAAIDSLFNTTSFINEEGATDWGYYWASTTHEKYSGLGDAGTYVAFARALGYFDGGSGAEVVDVHGAGAQRSNNKSNLLNEADATANVGYGTFYYHGPQGDILRLDNRVRCVRDISTH